MLSVSRQSKRTLMVRAGLRELKPGNLHVVLTSSGAAALELPPDALALQRNITLPKASRRPSCRLHILRMQDMHVNSSVPLVVVTRFIWANPASRP